MNFVKSLFTRYKTLNKAAKASLWFVVVSFLQQGCLFLTTPIFTRILTTEEYGVTSVYATWLGILTPIVTLYVASNAYNKSMMDHEGDLNQYTSSILTLGSIAVVVCYAVAYCFRNFIVSSTELPWELWSFMFLYIFFNSALTIWTMQQRYRFKYLLSSILNITMFILGPVLAVVFLNFAENDRSLVKIVTNASITLIISVGMYILLMKRGHSFIKPRYWKECLKLSLPLIPHNLSMTILSGSDRIMISSMVGYDSAAKYAVAYSIASIVGVLWNAINGSFMPWSLQKYKSGDKESINRLAIRLLLGYCVICFIPICVAPECLKILGTSEYYEAVWAIVPAMVGSMFIGVYSLFCNLEYATGKTQYIMIGSVSAAILNLALNFVFINLFGYIAASYTTLLSYIFLSVFHCLVLKKITGEVIYDVKKITAIMVGVTAFALVFQFTYSFVILRYCAFAVFMIVLFIKRDTLKSIFKF